MKLPFLRSAVHNVFTLAVVAFYVALWTTIFVFFIYRYQPFDLKIVHLLHFCTDVHKSQAAIFIFYIYSDSSAEERKDQIYQQQPIYQGETLLMKAQGNVRKS